MAAVSVKRSIAIQYSCQLSCENIDNFSHFSHFLVQFLLNFFEANKETMLSIAAICNLTLIHTSCDENCVHLVRSLARIGCDRALIVTIMMLGIAINDTYYK